MPRPHDRNAEPGAHAISHHRGVRPPGTHPRAAIVYHSAAGGTRLVAELLAELLGADHEISLCGIQEAGAVPAIAAADIVVLCYPTYFLRPSRSMKEFIGRLPRLERPTPAYLVTTFELYTENSLRACGRLVQDKGMAVMGFKAIRAPGSDVTCVIPDRLTPWLYRFERRLPQKLTAAAREVRAIQDSAAQGNVTRGSLPWPKWYTPLARIIQPLLDGFITWAGRIRVLPERCSDCGACVTACARGAWTRNGEGLRHDPALCELCTRCIHRCPKNAIVLRPRLKDNRRLDARLYARLKSEARAALQRSE